jgi:hypothetical protein
MPCRDYMDEFRSGPDPQVAELKARCDKLSRIACKALTHIEESEDGLEILVLKDPEIQEWWTAHKEADRKAQEEARRREEAHREKARLERIKKETLASLTPDQIKALGIKK